MPARLKTSCSRFEPRARQTQYAGLARFRKLTVFALAFGLSACAGELADEETIRDSQLQLRPEPRAPNQPPTAASPKPARTSDEQTGELEARPASPDAGPKSALGPGTEREPPSPSKPKPVREEEPPVAPKPLPIPKECGDVPKDIFANPKKCGTANCHGGTGEAPNHALGAVTDLGFSTEDVFERLKNQELSEGLCAGKSLIDPDNYEQSLLLQKLSDKPPCGFKMPYLGPAFAISEQDETCIAAWLKAKLGETK